jgi:hypothetical protein
VVPARWPASSGRGKLRHERMSVSPNQCGCRGVLSHVVSCRPTYILWIWYSACVSVFFFFKTVCIYCLKFVNLTVPTRFS